MDKKIKASLTVLNNELEENDFIVITKNKALYKTTSYEKKGQTWEENNELDILSSIGLVNKSMMLKDSLEIEEYSK